MWAHSSSLLFLLAFFWLVLIRNGGSGSRSLICLPASMLMLDRSSQVQAESHRPGIEEGSSDTGRAACCRWGAVEKDGAPGQAHTVLCTCKTQMRDLEVRSPVSVARQPFSWVWR